MEPNLTNLSRLLDEMFSLPSKDWTQYSPLTLAYVGDSIFDLVIRTVLVKRANRPTAKLNHMASRIVCAPAQARLAKAILPFLTGEELSLYRRGCNASPANKAKNATLEEYLEATGLETLLGCLYLQEKHERMLSLIRQGLEITGAEMD